MREVVIVPTQLAIMHVHAVRRQEHPRQALHRCLPRPRGGTAAAAAAGAAAAQQVVGEAGAGGFWAWCRPCAAAGHAAREPCRDELVEEQTGRKRARRSEAWPCPFVLLTCLCHTACGWHAAVACTTKKGGIAGPGAGCLLVAVASDSKHTNATRLPRVMYVNNTCVFTRSWNPCSAYHRSTILCMQPCASGGVGA